MHIHLLTHERETLKPSNTGALVKSCLQQDASVHIWQRREPIALLKKLIEEHRVALLYPVDTNQDGAVIEDFEHFIILDGTWQQARKMVNQSPYLQQAPRVELVTTQCSAYRLRRNQKEHGLCTAECAIELLRRRGDGRDRALQQRFETFNNPAMPEQASENTGPGSSQIIEIR